MYFVILYLLIKSSGGSVMPQSEEERKRLLKAIGPAENPRGPQRNNINFIFRPA